MKIRLGFVSNSSSSSFLAFGIRLNEEQRKKINEIERSLPAELEYWDIDDGWVSFCGKSWDSIGDNETGLQFKESVREALVSIFGEEVRNEAVTGEEAWYDG